MNRFNVHIVSWFQTFCMLMSHIYLFVLVFINMSLMRQRSLVSRSDATASSETRSLVLQYRRLDFKALAMWSHLQHEVTLGKLFIFRHDGVLTLRSSQVEDWFHERQDGVSGLLVLFDQLISSPFMLKTKTSHPPEVVTETMLQEQIVDKNIT